jgi:hypothetical protein
MEILERSEAFVEVGGDLTFSHTKIILKDDSEYFYATTDQRYRRSSDIDPSKLNCVPIDSSKVWLLCPADLTRAPETLPPNSYVKRPSLLYYGDTKASSETSTLLLQEARVCEILRKSPHPNIAKYLGCLVENGRIVRLCFASYGATLAQLVRNDRPLIKNHVWELYGKELSTFTS